MPPRRRGTRQFFGGTLDPAPVLREFLKSPKGTAPCPQTGEEPARFLGGMLDPVPVLREFLSKSGVAKTILQEDGCSLGGWRVSVLTRED